MAEREKIEFDYNFDWALKKPENVIRIIFKYNNINFVVRKNQ